MLRQFWCTCVNGFFQLGVMLHVQQRLVITRLTLQLFLGTTSRHPDPGTVLIRHTFTNKPLHCQNMFYYYPSHDQRARTNKQTSILFLYLWSSSPHEASPEGALTISWTSCWGHLHTDSSSPCRSRNRHVSQNRRRQSCWDKFTQFSTSEGLHITLIDAVKSGLPVDLLVPLPSFILLFSDGRL